MRVYSPWPLQIHSELTLEGGAARHIQVMRMQPGQNIVLFDGQGGEYVATILAMGRSTVTVRLREHLALERESQLACHLYIGVPANERMDWLVEKATELGAASIHPLMMQRSVLRLQGERAEKKMRHWQAIAIAACEQSGRNRIPPVRPICSLQELVRQQASDTTHASSGSYFRLSLDETAVPATSAWQSKSLATSPSVHIISGPEGGFSPAEEALLADAGWQALSLGTRTLRAETAPLAALSILDALAAATTISRL